MRFISFASILLAGSSAVLAAPASDQASCCCCDPLAKEVICAARDKPDDCICAQVTCPSDAKTVYASFAPAALTVTPTPTKAKRQVDPAIETISQCCCCDIKLGAYICSNADTCSCGQSKCPDGAPTIHATPGVTPTPPPKAHPLVGPIVVRDVDEFDEGFDNDYSDETDVDADAVYVREVDEFDEGFDNDDSIDTADDYDVDAVYVRDDEYTESYNEDSTEDNTDANTDASYDVSTDASAESNETENDVAECCCCSYARKEKVCTKSNQCACPQFLCPEEFPVVYE